MQSTSPRSASTHHLDSRPYILQFRPKTAAVQNSERNLPHWANHQRRMSQDTVAQFPVGNEEVNSWNAVMVEDRPVRSQTDCKRKKTSSGSAGLGEFRHGMRSMVRTASISVKTALHSSKRSRKGSISHNNQSFPTDAAYLHSSSNTTLNNTSYHVHPQYEPANLVPDYAGLSRFAFLRHPQERRNAISGPGSNFLEQYPHAMRSAFLASPYPPFLPNDPSQGAAARAAAAAAAAASQPERMHVASLPLVHNAKSRSTNSLLPRDSESGIFVDSQDEAEVESPVPLIRKNFVSCLPAEVSALVLSHLDGRTLANAERVSKAWREAASSRQVWRCAFLRRFSPERPYDRLAPHMGGQGIGQARSDQDWKRMYRARIFVERNWRTATTRPVYFTGHTDSVYCVQFDEEKIITGSRDRTIRVWDINSYECLRVIGGPAARPRASPSQDSLPVHPSYVPSPKSLNGTPEGDAIYHIPSDYHSASILCLQFDSEIMVTGSSDSDCIVWDIKTYEPRFRLKRHTMGVLDICFDERHIISCSKDQTICVWSRQTGQLLKCLQGHRGPVNAVQLRGNLLVSASGDGTAKLWNLSSGMCVKEFVSQDRGLAAVEFSADASAVLAGGNDTIVYKFSVATAELTHAYTGHAGLVRSLFLDAPNNRIISGSYDQSIRVYSYSEGRLMAQYPNWTTSWILAAKSDYRRIVATSQDGRALLLDFGFGVDGANQLKA